MTISGIAFVVCAALVIWITMMHRSTVTIVAAMERVRHVEEAEIALLLHATSKNPVVKSALASDLDTKLTRARRLAGSRQDEALFDRAEVSVAAYMSAPMDESDDRRAEAWRALEYLEAANLRSAQLARDHADRWNDVGDLVAASVAAALLVLTMTSLQWLKRRAFQPVLALADVMRRFGRGDRNLRVGYLGYEELELMRERFNEMANALAAQRDGQIAFLGSIAHDLRGPLASLNMAHELLRAGCTDDPRETRALEIADRQVEKLERMIGDFLDTAKIDAGTLELRWQVADAVRIVRDVVEPMRASSTNHTLVLDLPATPAPLRCDPVRLEQVVSNLVSNAIRYSPQGGTITITVVAVEREIRIIVSDTGIGIAEEDQGRLFEPFQRVGVTTSAIGGVGLGLFIVRRIVEAHGGRIELASAVGKGSTFTVSLPRDVDVPACT